ncbi:Lar family restriction alleviation protein [Pseudomonas aeruginosa]|uniref:Lar family restriction alleviation protein n=1 Tax=Pseudomonas aeruginosa TaxID=287 RepID=UPI00402BE33F
MAEELKPCPFCGCSMRLESNRDWHRIVGDHALECAFSDSETMVVPATKEQRDIAVSDWNARAVPAGHVVVSEGLLRRLLDSDGIDGIFDAQQNYAAHQELRALLSEQE